MIRGEDFISVATQLLATDNEARLRSAVSRAYYGAFHAAREFIASVDVRVPAHDVHEKLSWCLREAGEETPFLAGQGLNALRTSRNVADYDLEDGRFAKSENARAQVLLAITVVDTLAACRAEPLYTHLSAKIRAYASDVLKWDVI